MPTSTPSEKNSSKVLEQELERYTTAKDAVNVKFKQENNELDKLVEVLDELSKYETKEINKERLNGFLEQMKDQRAILGDAQRNLDSAYVMLSATKSVEIKITPVKAIKAVVKSPLKASQSLIEMNAQLKGAQTKFQDALQTSRTLLDKSFDLRKDIVNNHTSIREALDPSLKSTRPRIR